MNKVAFGILGVVGVIIVGLIIAAIGIGGFGVSKYNQLTSDGQAVDSKWAQVQNVYQRRADLVPNLVQTVAGAANFEKSTYTAVAEARASVGQLKIDASKAPATAEELSKFQAAQGQLSNALSRMMVVSENYPQLKSNENFLDLQAQLEGTENRIAVERKVFNDTTQTYNTALKTFPTNLIGNFFGFKDKPYFQADEAAKEAPKVNFDFNSPAK